MHRKTYHTLITIVLSVIFLFLSNNIAFSDWSANLLTNPGAENGGETGWTHTEYFRAADIQPQAGESVYPYSGSYFFTMAVSPSVYEKASQDIDVSDYSSSIDMGNTVIKAGVWMLNEYSGETPDSCKLTIQCLNSGESVISEDTTGELAHTDSNYWEEVYLVKLIPTNTKKVIFILEGFRHSGTYLNSFFDDAFLYIADFNITDSDSDGVPDQWDECPETAPGMPTDSKGCKKLRAVVIPMP